METGISDSGWQSGTCESLCPREVFGMGHAQECALQRFVRNGRQRIFTRKRMHTQGQADTCVTVHEPLRNVSPWVILRNALPGWKSKLQVGAGRIVLIKVSTRANHAAHYSGKYVYIPGKCIH